MRVLRIFCYATALALAPLPALAQSPGTDAAQARSAVLEARSTASFLLRHRDELNVSAAQAERLAAIQARLVAQDRATLAANTGTASPEQQRRGGLRPGAAGQGAMAPRALMHRLRENLSRADTEAMSTLDAGQRLQASELARRIP